MNAVLTNEDQAAVGTTTSHTGGMPVLRSWLPSAAGRERLLMSRGDPLFLADWLDVVFMHFEADPEVLQGEVPWQLDLFEGRAFVSLVAFTMKDMRPRFGGKLTALPFKPIATHEFLNVRTYMRHHGEPGIYFLAEWLPNALSVLLGPAVFGLPYRLGSLKYANDLDAGAVRGRIADARSGKAFEYQGEARLGARREACAAGSLDEFLLERYTAFTSFVRVGGMPALRRCFRIWHPPWPVVPLDLEYVDEGLLSLAGEWSDGARLISAHHSPGFPSVWMGWPHFIKNHFLS